MDADRFDALARALHAAGSRRGLLALLLALPGLGGLLALLAPKETAAKGRRKRRKKRHKHGRGNGRHRKGKRRKKCKRKSRTTICAGKCGIVKNRQTCKKRVDCGACACQPPCAVCQTCQAGPTTPGECVPDAARNGQPCGIPGEECLDGVCVQTCEDLLPTDDLQTAIDGTPEGETLLLCAGTWDLPAAVHIAQNLTLVGVAAGQTILQGQGNDRVLTIAAGAVVTVQDLSVSGGAGGIGNDGELTLHGVAVRDNATPGGGGGGGISNSSTGTLTLEDGAQITSNGATNGGGISNFGTLNLQDGARVAANTATNGGGLHNNTGGTVILQAGSVVGGDAPADANSAASNGGGIFNSGEVTLQGGSQVTGNTAQFRGGGIYNTGGTVLLEDGSQVTGNRTQLSDGGGIFNSPTGTVTLATGSQVTGNEAEDGGGIFNLGGTVTVQADAVICDNTPHEDQCNGDFTGPGACPFPVDGTCGD